MLAIALDVLHANGWMVPESAAVLGCTASQLLKLIREEPRAWVLLNAERKACALPTLH